MNAALHGRQLMAAISRSIATIFREHYGGGPMDVQTYVVDNMIFVVMQASGYIPPEQALVDKDDDGGDRVVAARPAFRLLVPDRYEQAIEQLTGRNVLAFLSQAHVDPDVTIEVFFMDGPLPGFDVAEIVARDATSRALAPG